MLFYAQERFGFDIHSHMSMLRELSRFYCVSIIERLCKDCGIQLTDSSAQSLKQTGWGFLCVSADITSLYSSTQSLSLLMKRKVLNLCDQDSEVRGTNEASFRLRKLAGDFADMHQRLDSINNLNDELALNVQILSKSYEESIFMLQQLRSDDLNKQLVLDCMRRCFRERERLRSRQMNI